MEKGDMILRFYDPRQPDVHTAPASALAQSLEAIQRLVYLMAMRQEGRVPGRRLRPSIDLQERYRLVCELPVQGSYLSPVRIESSGLLGLQDAASTMDEVDRLLDGVRAGDSSRFGVPTLDETWRGFVVEALERVIPSAHSGVELEVRRHSRVLLDSVSARPFVERLARQTTHRSARGSVVGEFKRIDFAKHGLTIRHLGTDRDLSCVYEAHVEASLLDHPREQLLVFGSVTRDADGRPISIDDVDHIEPIDLSAISIGPVVRGNATIMPIEAISAAVAYDEAEAVCSAAVPSLTISVFAETREMLVSALEDDIAVLWKRYVMAPDDKLTRASIVLKQRVLAAFQTLPNAA